MSSSFGRVLVVAPEGDVERVRFSSRSILDVSEQQQTAQTSMQQEVQSDAAAQSSLDNLPKYTKQLYAELPNVLTSPNAFGGGSAPGFSGVSGF